MSAELFVLQRPASAAERAAAARNGVILNVVEVACFPNRDQCFTAWKLRYPKMAGRVLHYPDGRGAGHCLQVARTSWGWGS